MQPPERKSSAGLKEVQRNGHHAVFLYAPSESDELFPQLLSPQRQALPAVSPQKSQLYMTSLEVMLFQGHPHPVAEMGVVPRLFGFNGHISDAFLFQSSGCGWHRPPGIHGHCSFASVSSQHSKLLTSTVKVQCQFLSEPDCLPGTGHRRGFRQRYPPMAFPDQGNRMKDGETVSRETHVNSQKWDRGTE